MELWNDGMLGGLWGNFVNSSLYDCITVWLYGCPKESRGIMEPKNIIPFPTIPSFLEESCGHFSIIPTLVAGCAALWLY